MQAEAQGGWALRGQSVSEMVPGASPRGTQAGPGELTGAVGSGDGRGIAAAGSDRGKGVTTAP